MAKARAHLDRWAVRDLEQTASQTLHAARFLREADPVTKEQYLKVLEQVLSALPEDVDLEVSKDLLDALFELSTESVKQLVKRKVFAHGSLVQT